MLADKCFEIIAIKFSDFIRFPPHISPILSQATMSSDPLKKRKSKVLRGEGAVPEMKRGRVEGDQQVSTYGRIKPDLLHQLSSG